MSTGKYFEQVAMKFFAKWEKSHTEVSVALKYVYDNNIMQKSLFY